MAGRYQADAKQNRMRRRQLQRVRTVQPVTVVSVGRKTVVLFELAGPIVQMDVGDRAGAAGW